MKLTSLIYRSVIGIYKALPFKKNFAMLVRSSGLPVSKVYQDMKFKGEFTVPVDDSSFRLMHHESTLENEIFWHGLGNTWEDDTIWVWKLLCRDAQVIVDIGANSGIYSLIAKTLNPKAKVYAFEPVARTKKILEANVDLNGFDVKVEQVAISNKNGEAVFYDTTYENQTSASLNPDKLKDSKDSKIVEYNVPTMTLDAYLAQNAVGRVDLVKMDIEMHEPEAVAGYLNGLKRDKPTIVIEILTTEIGERVQKLIADCDYHIYHLKGKNKMVKVDKLVRVDNLWNYLLCTDSVAQRLKAYMID